MVTDDISIQDEPDFANITRLPDRPGDEPSTDDSEWEAVDGIEPGETAPDLDEFLAEADPDYDWIVPGLIEARDRVILTGQEGKGKSTLLRQIGVQIASGIHPFTHEPIDPKRVLLIDCENSAKQLRRHLGPLRETASTDYRTGHLRVRVAPNGMDLLNRAHRDHLTTIVNANQPQLLIIGPIYKMAAGDPVKEEPAREVARTIDYLRHIHDLAVMIEAHSPYAASGTSKREIRPYGASLWSRWPEFGLHIADDGKLHHWRGDREERAWPTALTRGGAWPWTVNADAQQPYSGPTHCIAECVRLFGSIAPAELTANQTVDRLRERGIKFQKKTILDALRIAAQDGQLSVRYGSNNSLNYRLHDDTEQTLNVPDPDEPF